VSGGLRLPRAARIRDEPSIHRLQSATRARGRWFAIAAIGNGRDQSRLLVRIAKKVLKSAVARNRMRRCVKEVFRRHRAQLAVRDFLVFLIRPYREQTLDAARRELEQLLRGAAQ
jgi:ribonuclease P protein component